MIIRAIGGHGRYQGGPEMAGILADVWEITCCLVSHCVQPEPPLHPQEPLLTECPLSAA